MRLDSVWISSTAAVAAAQSSVCVLYLRIKYE